MIANIAIGSEASLDFQSYGGYGRADDELFMVCIFSALNMDFQTKLVQLDMILS